MYDSMRATCWCISDWIKVKLVETDCWCYIIHYTASTEYAVRYRLQ